MANFYLIGLTGNLGSGKSTVRRMLEQLGALGLDADKLAHAAMQRGKPAWRAIVETFGPEVLQHNGRIDRQKLGARVFENPAALAQLEAITHPAVGEIIKQELRQTQVQVVVVEAIKLFEANLHLWCDALWVVTATPDAQVARVMRERQMSAEEARARLATQSHLDEKLARADVVIDNSQDLSATKAQVENAWRNTIHLEQARDKSEWLYGAPRVEPTTTPPPAAPAETRVEPMPPAVATPEPSPVEPQATAETAPVEAAPVVAEVAPAPEPTVEITPPIEEAQLPSPMPIGEIEVRRARRSDLNALGVALAAREGRAEPLARAEVIQRLGERGYRIAVGGQRIIALAAWEAENLVATVRDVWAESGDIAPRALPQLFALVEADARALQCEVSLVLLDPQTPAFVAEQVTACEYQPRELSGLHRHWRQVVEERLQPSDHIWVKRLREDMVTRPI
ncbi:MAG: dephospho-CoA kinase [Chloroflexi bacterium]|nr:dephospho-CoA kinase [Chloroflexota bacterium]